MDYGISNRAPFSSVTGRPEMSDVARDNVDALQGGFDYMEGSGSQSGSHPAKSQPRTMKPLE